MYLLPNSSHSLNTDKFASVFYVVVIPMLNPLIEESGSKECTEENYRKVAFGYQLKNQGQGGIRRLGVVAYLESKC